MSKKRKNQCKTLPTIENKKSKIMSNECNSIDNANRDETNNDLKENFDESEIIEISSDDRSEISTMDCVNPPSFANDMEMMDCFNFTRFTDMATKDNDCLGIVYSDNNKVSDVDATRSGVSLPLSSHSSISIGGSETLSIYKSNKRKRKSSKQKTIQPMIEEMYIVEKILAMRVVDGVRQFLLKWEGFPDSENSWEPEENIDSKDIIMEYLVDFETMENINKANSCASVKTRQSTISNIECVEATNSNCVSEENENVVNKINNATKSDSNENKMKKKVQKNPKKKSKMSTTKNSDTKNVNENEIDLTLDDDEIGDINCDHVTDAILDNCVNKEEDEATAACLEDVATVVEEETVGNCGEEKELAVVVNEDVRECARLNKTASIDSETTDANKDDSHCPIVGETTKVGVGSAYYGTNVLPEGQEIFQVEKILRMRWSHGLRYFYLKWEGFPDSENSWEPECNLECPELIEEFINNLKQPKPPTAASAAKKPRGGPPWLDATAKASTTAKKASVVLERLPDETRIKDPLLYTAKGFPKERVAEVVLSSGVVDGELCYLIKWKNADSANIVSSRRANVECPQTVIEYYERSLVWQNEDGTLSAVPQTQVSVREMEERERRERRARLEEPRPPLPPSPLISSPSPIKRKKRVRPSRSVAPGMVQARKLATGASKMLNIIHNFQSRKSHVPTTAEAVEAVETAPGLDQMVTQLYESMDLPGTARTARATRTVSATTTAATATTADAINAATATISFQVPPAIAPTMVGLEDPGSRWTDPLASLDQLLADTTLPGPRFYHQRQQHQRHVLSQHSSPNVTVARSTNVATRHKWCPIQAQNGIDRLMATRAAPMPRSMSASSLRALQSPVHHRPQQQPQQQQQVQYLIAGVPLATSNHYIQQQQQQQQPIQYQYVQPQYQQQQPMTNDNSYLMTANQNQQHRIYYQQPHNLVNANQSPPPLPQINNFITSQTNQMPVMFDSQQMNNDQLNRISYLNLGAFM